MGGGTEAFPDLGQHCQHSDCNQLDFLPFNCDGCQKVQTFIYITLFFKIFRYKVFSFLFLFFLFGLIICRNRNRIMVVYVFVFVIMCRCFVWNIDLIGPTSVQNQTTTAERLLFVRFVRHRLRPRDEMERTRRPSWRSMRSLVLVTPRRRRNQLALLGGARRYWRFRIQVRARLANWRCAWSIGFRLTTCAKRWLRLRWWRVKDDGMIGLRLLWLRGMEEIVARVDVVLPLLSAPLHLSKHIEIVNHERFMLFFL